MHVYTVGRIVRSRFARVDVIYDANDFPDTFVERHDDALSTGFASWNSFLASVLLSRTMRLTIHRKARRCGH